jgi:hypothetical protein
MTAMRHILATIATAQAQLAELLASYLDHHGTTREQYVRYLSFQYHLTKGVQRYFLRIAAHPDLARRRKMRLFLSNFANEEELHYLVAASDLDKLGELPLPLPFDVELWHSYFNNIVDRRPFVRLGAATILENISDGVAKPWVRKALTGSFLNRDNTKFLVLHQHETLPHGDQLLKIIDESNLTPGHFEDLYEGACKGTVLYLRMARWAIEPKSDSILCDFKNPGVSQSELDRIRSFEMSELNA